MGPPGITLQATHARTRGLVPEAVPVNRRNLSTLESSVKRKTSCSSTAFARASSSVSIYSSWRCNNHMFSYETHHGDVKNHMFSYETNHGDAKNHTFSYEHH